MPKIKETPETQEAPPSGLEEIEEGGSAESWTFDASVLEEE